MTNYSHSDRIDLIALGLAGHFTFDDLVQALGGSQYDKIDAQDFYTRASANRWWEKVTEEAFVISQAGKAQWVALHDGPSE